MQAVCRHVLSPEQVAAATHGAQRLIILAGPGTGKTHVIANRIVHKVQASGMKPEEVLALTFTDSAADTLRRRVAAISGSDSLARDCAVQTFHSFAIDLLKTHALEAGLSPTFRVCNPVEESVFLQNHLKLLDAPDDYRHPRALPQLLKLFSSIQELGICREKLADSAPTISTMFRSFQRLKRDASILTFTDIIDKCIALLNQRPDLAKMVIEAYRHILVDEFQDINPSLLDLLTRITDSPDIHTTVVGDGDQSIFGFRGASEASLKAFQQRHPESVTVQLTCSFRCPKEVISASQRLIRHNQHSIVPSSDREEMISACDVKDSNIDLLSHSTVEQSTQAIAQHIGDFLRKSQLSYDDVCVLARNNSQCSRLAELLADEGVPVYVSGGGLGHAVALQTLISFLRAITQPNDSKALFNAISSKAYRFTPIQLADLLEGLDISSKYVAEKWPLWRRIERAAKSSDDSSMQKQCEAVLCDFRIFRANAIRNGIRKLASEIATVLDISKDHMEAFNMRVHYIESALKTSSSFLIVPYLTKLASHGDKYWDEEAPIRPTSPSVTVMTIHKAKGSEFPLVVLSIQSDRRGLHQKSILNLPASLYSPEAIVDPIEEERRLVYVALTRAARRFVFASVARSPGQISRFVSEALGVQAVPNFSPRFAP